MSSSVGSAGAEGAVEVEASAALPLPLPLDEPFMCGVSVSFSLPGEEGRDVEAMVVVVVVVYKDV